MRVLKIVLCLFCFVFLTSEGHAAERVYLITKTKVGGDGSGNYLRIKQSKWKSHKGEFTVTITCESPGPSACKVQSWPPVSSKLPTDISTYIVADFALFISANDEDHENDQAVNNVAHHQYQSTEGVIDIYFHCVVKPNGTIEYEMIKV